MEIKVTVILGVADPKNGKSAPAYGSIVGLQDTVVNRVERVVQDVINNGRKDIGVTRYTVDGIIQEG